jgi:hypothetical protein
MIAAIAVIYETNSFHGQVNGNIVSFATRQGFLGKLCFDHSYLMSLLVTL